MKIILMSVGTRGDMEPFIAIGEILEHNGHQVICAFPEQFKSLAQESNLQFASLGSKYIELLESADGKAAMGGGGSGLEKFMATVRLAKNQGEANRELVQRQYELVENEKPDRIVYNGKAVYPIIWSIKHPGKAVMVSPIPYMHYVKDHTHVAFNNNFGPALNRLTYGLADFGLAATVMTSSKWLGIADEINRSQVKQVLASNKAIYAISPSLFARPNTWGDHLDVLGYHQRSTTTTWEPDQALKDFLERHERILFITFGSMTNPAPLEKTGILLEILERNQIPAIINTAAGGLVQPDGYASEWVHFISRIPYDWIFPRVYGVIHHGGSGTTHLALKYACATLIIPHIIDQFVWNQIVYEKGAGPKGIKIAKISTKNLEPKLLDLLKDESYKAAAEDIAGQMATEDFKEAVHQAIVEDYEWFNLRD